MRWSSLRSGVATTTATSAGDTTSAYRCPVPYQPEMVFDTGSQLELGGGAGY